MSTAVPDPALVDFVKEKPGEVEGAIVVELNGSGGAAVVKEIADIRKTANSIRKDFVTVTGVLRTFDHKGYTKKDGTKVAKLEPQWTLYSNNFDKFLTASKNAALKGVAYADAYRLMTDNLEKFRDRKQLTDTIDKHLARVAESEKDADDVKNNFIELQTGVNKFTTVIDDVVKDAEEGVEAAVEEAKGNVTTLETRLAQLKRSIEAAALAVKAGGLLSAAGAALTATGILAPLAMGLALIGGLVAAGAKIAENIKQKELDEVTVKLAAAKTALAEAEKNQAEFSKIKSELDGAKTVIGDLSTKLGIIVNIWTVFQADAANLKKQIQEAQASESLADIKTRLGANGTGALYKRFGQALGDYASNLSDD